MPIGVELRLYDGATAQASMTGIQAMWWDVTEPKDGSRPIGKSSSVTTDANGDIFLDLSNVTGLSVGDYGFLMLYKLDATDHEDSLVFAGKVQTSTITSGVDMYYYDSGWTRPAGWLSLGTPLTSSDEKVVGLAKVGNHGSNFIAFTCSGAYTVDWGDGNTPTDYASGATAEKNLAYADYAGSECTHNNETYRQAIITITPQSGSTLTSVDLSVNHSQATSSYGTPWLDISISGPNLTSLFVGKNNYTCRHSALEQVTIANIGTVSTFSFLFNFCYALRSVYLPDATSSVTSCFSMFNYCYSLTAAPFFDTSACTTFGSMFYFCRALQRIPKYASSSLTKIDRMFYECNNIESVPVFDTSNCSDFSYMFQSNYMLKQVPAFDTSSATTMLYMFRACTSLRSIPLFDTSLVTNFEMMFLDCISLESIPAINTSSGQDFDGMFRGCISLSTVPSLTASSCTSANDMFLNCKSIRKVLLTGMQQNVVISGSLGADELDALYTSLGSVTDKTITVTDNWGTASDDPSIATAKGWTVTS